MDLRHGARASTIDACILVAIVREATNTDTTYRLRLIMIRIYKYVPRPHTTYHYMCGSLRESLHVQPQRIVFAHITELRTERA